MTHLRSRACIFLTGRDGLSEKLTSPEFDHDPNVAISNEQWKDLLSAFLDDLGDEDVDFEMTALISPVEPDGYTLAYTGGVATAHGGSWDVVTMTPRPQVGAGRNGWATVPESCLRTWADDWLARGDQSTDDFVTERMTLIGLKEPHHA